MKLLYVSASDGVHDRRMIDAWKMHSVEIESITLPTDGSQAELVSRTIAAARPDVVQAGPVHNVAHEVSLLWHGPLIVTSWGFDLLADVDEDDVIRERAEYALQRADAVIVDNDAVRERALELGAARAAVVQFPWGVDHGLFAAVGENLRAELGIDSTALCLISVRRHEPLYDVKTLVRAFTRISDLLPTASMIVAGVGSETTALMSLVDAASLGDRVHFVGELDGLRLAAAYRSADLYVSTSTVDGSSISLLEAMASGAVPIVADIPGNREWVQEATGVRFPVGDDARLAGEIVKLASDPEARGRMADASAQIARDRADWKRGASLLRHSADIAVQRWRGWEAR